MSGYYGRVNDTPTSSNRYSVDGLPYAARLRIAKTDHKNGSYEYKNFVGPGEGTGSILWNEPELTQEVSYLEEKLDRFRIEEKDRLNQFTDFDQRIRAFASRDYGSVFFDDQRSEDALRELAWAGHQLFQAFLPEGEQKRIANLPPGARIEFRCLDMSHSIPLQLMYIQNPDEDKIRPSEFLGIKHHVSLLQWGFERSRSPHLWDHVYYWKTTDSKGDVAYREADWQQDRWSNSQRVRQIASNNTDNNKSKVREWLADVSDETSVLYLYGRCSFRDSTPTLHFGKPPNESEKIEIDELPRNEYTESPVAFLNVCKSAQDGSIGNLNLLTKHFIKRKCCAVLGTTHLVPPELASKFAASVFYFLDQGFAEQRVSFGEAVTLARRFLWDAFQNPGGLFYNHSNKFDIYV